MWNSTPTLDICCGPMHHGAGIIYFDFWTTFLDLKFATWWFASHMDYKSSTSHWAAVLGGPAELRATVSGDLVLAHPAVCYNLF